MLSYSKTVGECYLLTSGITNLLDKKPWEIFLKLSGRYELNNNFSFDRIYDSINQSRRIVVKEFTVEQWNEAICYTFFYAVPRELITQWIQNMIWINLVSNKKEAGDVSLHFECSLMAHYEQQYLCFVDDVIGVTARSWAQGAVELEEVWET